MSQNFLNYIGGQWVPARSGRTFWNHDPATGEALGEFPASALEDVDAAVAAAAKAFRGWRLTPAPKRAEIVFRAGEIIRARKEDLARAMTREMGKVLIEARGDVQEGIDMAYLAAGEGRRMYGVTTPSEMPDKWAMSVRAPVGVVGVITPWNFPFAIPSWKLMPALVAGNTAVFKPAGDTPEMAWHFTKILEEAGLPPGVLNLVFGSGAEVGNPMVEHPGIHVISFTGSTDVGLAIAGRGGALGKRISLEMGGKNAIIVMDDADLAHATDAIAWSAFGTTGQRCTACSRVLVHGRVHDELADRVTAKAKQLKLGSGLEPTTDVGPLVNRSQVEKVHAYVEIGAKEGTLAAGGGPARDGALAKGHFYRPTVFRDVPAGARIAVEEIFGPVLAMVKVESLEQAIEINNASRYGLSAAIFTRDVKSAFAAMRDLETGIVYVNHGTTGAETHLPFGGTRGTGNGHREAGHTMLDPFTEWKSIYVDFSGRLQRAQIDNA
ncbi:MAG: aldehyde dehydrogenase family protein [Candidatus Eisenbacteria bacterium]|uniref:aldehyde dehydrogenase (NAD(+)) n=1 Tax=Eiseniibacteriota bacterium TaxID=2212470 RepID=A0A9D6L4X2_UNCEI|nr:aldehyde dehydrogenase family protein [Candidatus Eisenbacteria bacterium]MBI3538856.1 aldehyde dehydrogenase family protein [Candidatus Eisenbacteria bacterium]